MLTSEWLGRLSLRRWPSVVVLLMILSGCQPDTSPSTHAATNPWLAHVPKNSPFLVANQKPLEDAEFDRLFQTVGPLLRLLNGQLQPFDGAQDWREAGLDPNGFWAIYSHNKQMVARIPLSDEAAFWSSWKRANGPTPTQQQRPTLPISKDLDGPHQQADISLGSLGQPWLTLLGFPTSGLLSVETQGQWLSVSWQNKQANEIDAVPMPDQKPSTEHWSQKTWAAFNQAHDLDGKVGGYINLPALMTQQAQANPDCDRAWTKLGNQMPQLIIGSQVLTAQEMTFLSRVLLSDTDAGISSTSMSPPNIDVSQARLAKVAGLGLAIDVAKSRQTLLDQLQLSQEASQDCPGLEPIKQSRRWAQGLANRPVPPIITSIQGLMTRFDGLETDGETTPTDQPKRQAANFLTEVHLQNPQFLIGLAGLFSPDLASLDLRAYRPPQPLPSNLIDAFGSVPVYLSTTSSSIRASSHNQLDLLSETTSEEEGTLPWVSGTLNFKRLTELSDVMKAWPMGLQNQALLEEVVYWGSLADIDQLQWLIRPSQEGIDLVISTQHSLASLPTELQ